MNHTHVAGGEVADLVREFEVSGTEAVVHGITLTASRLFAASGAYLMRLVPGSGRLIDQLETWPAPGGLGSDQSYLWQLSQGRLQQLAGRTGFVVRSAELKLDDVAGLEWVNGDLLVLHAGGRSLAHVEIVDHSDWVDANVISSADGTVPLRGLAWLGDELWSSTADALVRIDPASARVLRRLALAPGVSVCDLAGDCEGRLWSVDGRNRTVRAFEIPRWRQDRARPEEPVTTASSLASVAGDTFTR